MDVGDINPDSLPEILGAIALAHACELLESVTERSMHDWRYRFRSQALCTIGQLSEDQLSKLIDEQFIKEKAMEITTVYYSALFNLGNYSNERIALSAKLGEGETPEQLVATLKEKVLEIAGPDPRKVHDAILKGRRELDDLNDKIERATEQWKDVAEFLRRQGIKPDVEDMPIFGKILASASSHESSDIIQGEVEEEDQGGEREF